MRFPSLKKALGHYGARRKGPRQPSSIRGGVRLSPNAIDAHRTHVRIGEVLSMACSGEDQLERILSWAMTSDFGGGRLTRGDHSALEVVRTQLDEMGLLDRPVLPVECESRVFVDIETGKTMTTKAAR